MESLWKNESTVSFLFFFFCCSLRPLKPHKWRSQVYSTLPIYLNIWQGCIYTPGPFSVKRNLWAVYGDHCVHVLTAVVLLSCVKAGNICVPPQATREILLLLKTSHCVTWMQFFGILLMCSRVCFHSTEWIPTSISKAHYWNVILCLLSVTKKNECFYSCKANKKD